MPRLSTACLLAAVLCGLAPLTAQAQGKPSGLPDGAEKALVEGVCTACHPVNQITQSSGYTREGWKELAGTMIDLGKTPEEQSKITEYLATHFPPNSKRAPKLMSGDAKIAFKEWVASDFYRADGLATAAKDPQRGAELDDVGLVRMLSPEQVERKVAAVFGQRWGKLQGELATLYGGIDSKEVTDRATDPSGAMGAIQRILANDVACKNVLREEAPAQTARRLALAKASAVARRFADALVIGADQVAHCAELRLDKPGSHERAMQQLTSVSGRIVSFETAVACSVPSATAVRSRPETV